MTNMVGREIGKYRILERIGRGGMADVYLGNHTHLDRKVAIKILHSYLLESGDFIERFKREAKAVASLRHPNIVQVYDFDVQDDIIFMVMEFIEGINLQQQLEELGRQGKRIPIKQIGSIINDIASALDYAHSKGMLHRDIKPSNILLDKEGKAYLTDFGIAKILGDHKMTATGTLVGTPAYMSPEQGRGEELTEESDIYSLGIVAFEMLTGHVPFDAKTPIGIVQKQITAPVPEISKLVKDVPNSTQDVIDKALAKSPQGRYGSAEELVKALRLTLQALEYSDNTLIETNPIVSKVDDEAVSAQTVEMNQVPSAEDYEKSTVVMEEEKDSAEDQGEQKGGKAKQGLRNKPSKTEENEEILGQQKSKRKIPLWAIIAAGVVVVGGIGALLTQIIKPNVPEAKAPTTVVKTLDYSMVSTKTPSANVAPTSEPEVNLLNRVDFPIVFDADHRSDGLSLSLGWDRDVEITLAGNNPETVWQTGNGEVMPADPPNDMGDYYMEFLLDDEIILDVPEGLRVRLEIEYLDSGTDLFGVNYDAQSGGPYSNGSYFNTDLVQKTNSGEFLNAVFILDNARFANGNNGADFRITDMGDGAEIIRRVIVTIIN